MGVLGRVFAPEVSTAPLRQGFGGHSRLYRLRAAYRRKPPEARRTEGGGRRAAKTRTIRSLLHYDGFETMRMSRLCASTVHGLRGSDVRMKDRWRHKENAIAARSHSRSAQRSRRCLYATARFAEDTPAATALRWSSSATSRFDGFAVRIKSRRGRSRMQIGTLGFAAFAALLCQAPMTHRACSSRPD